jgi:hypothetical protein
VSEALVIHARPMGYFEGGDDPRRWDAYKTCPICGGRMSPNAIRCVQCYGRSTAQNNLDRFGLDEQRMDNHHRFEAALLAGWTFVELLVVRPAIPTWEELCARCPEVVLKWHPEMMIQTEWQKGNTRWG